MFGGAGPVRIAGLGTGPDLTAFEIANLVTVTAFAGVCDGP